MSKYTIKKFSRDCKSIGWYGSKIIPEWRNIGTPIREKNLKNFLMYKECDNASPIIMNYWTDSDDGVNFRLSSMAHSKGHGFVTNTEDLFTYMKVSGYDKGFISKNFSKKSLMFLISSSFFNCFESFKNFF